VPLGRQKDLRLARQPPERLGVNDAVAIVLEDRPRRVGGLRAIAPLAGAALLGERREDLLLVVFQLFPDGGHRPFFFGLPRGRLLRPSRFSWRPGRCAPGLPRSGLRSRRRLSPRAKSRPRWRARSSASAKSLLRRRTLTYCTLTRT